MKITKRQLRRIIKEEKARLLREWTPPLEELSDDVNDAMFQLLDQQLTEWGIDRFADVAAAEEIAGALEDIARMVRNDAKFTAKRN